MSLNHFNARARSSVGFTLIEVLLGVMILALGLLGLGAVFPLVVKQQRTAQDAVVGISTAKGAESYLRSHFGLTEPGAKNGWAAVSRQLYSMLKTRPEDKGRLLWSQLLSDSGSFPFYGSNGDNFTSLPGTLRIANTMYPGNDVYIKSTDRLLPAGLNSADPLFVWDIAPSLADQSVARTLVNPSYLPIRITVFVRRLDPGIRPPGGKSILQAIGDGLVVPVAADGDGLATLDGKGVPVNGRPKYSSFKFPEADRRVYRRFDASGGAYNVLTFSKASNPDMAALRQIGQQLVDPDGNVYTVVAFPDESEEKHLYGGQLNQSVVISPGIPDAILSGGNLPSNFEFLCTPQIPAAVASFVIHP